MIYEPIGRDRHDLDLAASTVRFSSRPPSCVPSEMAARVRGADVQGVNPTPMHSRQLCVAIHSDPERPFEYRAAIVVSRDRASIERLAAFASTRPASAVLGSHIEISSAGQLFVPRSTYQPNEAALALTLEDLLELKERLGQSAEAPAQIALKNLVVAPMGALQRALSNVLKWIGAR